MPEAETLDDAIQALAEHDGATWVGLVGRWPFGQRQHCYVEDAGGSAREEGIDGVVWTDIKAGFRDARGAVPTLNDVLGYLGCLTNEDRDAATGPIAKATVHVAMAYIPELERLPGIDAR